MKISLKVVEANETIMDFLEQKGAIRRLLPGKDRLNVKEGQSKWQEIYASDDRAGPHKLISVTVNNTKVKALVYHDQREEFLLLDQGQTADLILIVCLLPIDRIQRKAKDLSIVAEDFVALKCKMNHPQLSFFTMEAGYLHTEISSKLSKIPPSFYVTESRDIDENEIDLSDFKFEIENELEDNNETITD